MGVEFAVEGVAFAEGGAVADDDEFHAGACHGHVDAAQVAQEAYVAVFVAAHK